MVKTYQAYVDASGGGDPNFHVIAGYIAPAEIWIEFSKEWKCRLDHAGLPYFKMNEMAQSSQKMEIAGWFYRVIEEYNITAAISCLVRTADLVKVIRNFPWPPDIINLEPLENPYYFAFKAITDVLAQHQMELGIDEPIDFIFDDQSEAGKLHDAWDRMKLASSPDIRKLMGRRPSFANDKGIMPIQAADLYAWWILKWAREDDTDAGVRDLKFAWKPQKEIIRLHMEFSEHDFLTEYQRWTKPEILSKVRAINTLMQLINEGVHVDDRDAALREIERQQRGITMTFPDPTSRWRI